MAKLKSEKKSCRDVFNAFLVPTADYDGVFEFPTMQKENWIPNRLIPFSKAASCKNCAQWIHFYEFDYQFERVWRNPKRYLNLFKRFAGVILPDFSIYRDMPLAMQLWNIYRSRAIGHWLESNGIKIIPNIRFGDERTYQPCCDGIALGSTISIGTYGLTSEKEDLFFLNEGLAYAVERTKPQAIVVYGATPDDVFRQHYYDDIEIIRFDPETNTAHGKETF